MIRSEVPFLFVELNPFFWDTNTINLITDYVWRVLVGSRKKKEKKKVIKNIRRLTKITIWVFSVKGEENPLNT